MFKKLDIVIIIALIIISFIPEIVFGTVMGYKYDMTYAEITVGGEVYSKIPLSAHKGEEIIDINLDGHENKIVINLPKPYVIVLEESRDVPDKYKIN